MQENLPQVLKVSTEWIELEILSEPNVVITFHGYAPYVIARRIKTSVEYLFYISAKSLAVSLEKLRIKNNGNFTGIMFRVRKESMDRMAKYELQSIDREQEVTLSGTDQVDMSMSDEIQKKLEQILS